MKTYFYAILFLIPLVSFSQNQCDSQIEVNADLNSGQTDNQSAGSILAANNTITNANAVYTAGTTIVLNDGFSANSDSDVLFSIEECGTTSQKSLDSETNLFDVSFYPNPTSGLFTIQSNELVVSYSIYNGIGEQILFEEGVNTNTLNINISTFPSGFYLVEVLMGNGKTVREKIIKN